MSEVSEEVWKFPKISSKKQRVWYTAETFSHPAKMDIYLTRRLLKAFTKRGDAVLDPMCGTGTTLIEAILLGRNAVGVDIEDKFTALTEKNIENVEKTNSESRFKLELGNAKVLTGDSRRLASLLQRADVIVTSPPYSEQLQAKADYAKRKERLKKLGFTKKTHGLLRGQKSSSKVVGGDERYSDNPENIGNLKHGELNPTIARLRKHGRTNPKQGGPYGKSLGHPYIGNPTNIGNLKHGELADVVMTSPPYADISKPGNVKKPISKEEFEERKRKGDHLVYHDNRPGREGTLYEYYEMIPIDKYGSEENIDRLPHGSIDAIVMSPPFAEANRGGGIAQKGYKGKHGVDETLHLRQDKPLSDNPENISNLPLGKVDTVLMSPPYSEGIGHACRVENIGVKTAEPIKGSKAFQAKAKLQKKHMAIKLRNQNIGSLKHGEVVDVVFMSPPYSEGLGHGGGASSEKLRKEKDLCLHGAGSYSGKQGNIGEMRKHGSIDTIMTSPPYEGTCVTSFDGPGWTKFFSEMLKEKGCIEWRGKRYSEEEWRSLNHGRIDGRTMIGVPKGVTGYSGNKENIGNLKKETYLSAMLEVYREMHAVLKPGGLAILVLKNFIRNFKVVDLVSDTVKLCEFVGFKLTKKIKFRLPTKSFWRVLYERKYQKKFGKALSKEFDSVYKYETVLVFEKA